MVVCRNSRFHSFPFPRHFISQIQETSRVKLHRRARNSLIFFSNHNGCKSYQIQKWAVARGAFFILTSANNFKTISHEHIWYLPHDQVAPDERGQGAPATVPQPIKDLLRESPSLTMDTTIPYHCSAWKDFTQSCTDNIIPGWMRTYNHGLLPWKQYPILFIYQSYSVPGLQKT